ncbi:MAG: hypothetical protein R2881_03295 [Eubacteriales bacterium]
MRCSAARRAARRTKRTAAAGVARPDSLGGAYYFAWTTEIPGIALGLFFPLAIAVIIATYLLFLCGSIVVLRLLRMKKSLYYQPDHFVTISGMFHRMRQNQGLATI